MKRVLPVMLLFGAASIALVPSAWAQPAGQMAQAQPAFTSLDSVDAALTACKSAPAHQNTADMTLCYNAAAADYQKILDRVYQNALAGLDAPSAALLKQSQDRWQAYRDAERSAEGGPWRQNAGTFPGSQIAPAETNALRQRIQEIQIFQGPAGH